MNSLLRIYSYSKCGTCRKALNWLNSKNIKYELIDITLNPPSKQNLLDGLKQFGDKKYLLNTSGKSYRQIGAASIKSKNDHDVIELLGSDPKLIKRPFVISPNGKILIGFNQLIWEDFFQS